MFFLRIIVLAFFLSFNLPSLAQADLSLEWYPNSDRHNMGMGIYPLPPPSNKLPEVFLPYEHPKDSAFVKLTMLEVREDAPYNELIIKIREEGKKQGVDAILILDKKREFETDGRHFETLTGVGIRYIKNMNYLNSYVKWQKVYFQNSAESPVIHAVTVAYNYDSEVWKLLPEIIPNGDTVFTKYVRRWSPQHLLTETKNWKYVAEYKDRTWNPDYQFPVKLSSSKYYDKVLERTLYTSYYHREKKCKLTYDSDGKVASVEITYFLESANKKKNKDIVYFKWRPDGLIQKTDIHARNGLHFREHFFYDAENRLQYSSMVRVLSDKQEIPFIKSTYEYFSIADFE
jgi:hypothetical protein